jgi:aminoglycoside phosphotransferase (APT) family kinase protein
MDDGALRAVAEQVGLPAQVAFGPDVGSPGRTSVRQVGDDLYLKVFLGQSGRKAHRERAALELLASSRVPAPRVAGHGHLADGSPWVLVTRLPGTPLGRLGLPQPETDAQRTEWYRWAGRTAVELHEVDVPAFGPWTADPVDDAATHYRERSVGLLAEALAVGRLDRQLLERVSSAQLELASSLRSIGSPVLVHRDLNPHNLLARMQPDGSVIRTGIIDFESSGGGDPLEDLRWLPVAQPRRPVEEAFLDGYGSTVAMHRSGADRTRYHQLDLILDIATWPTMEDRSLIARAEHAAQRLLSV